METLVALGATAALAYSVWQTVVGSGHVYYDTADMLLGLVMVGKYIESGTRQNANDALTLLYGLLPRKATILKGGRQIPVAIAQLADGDIILVKAGERIAADGVIEDGGGTVDESLLSGESKPVNKRIGERTIGGTILMDGALTVKVNRIGDAGTLNIIIQHVQDALASKTPVEKLADRISRVFVPIVLSLAIASGVGLAVFGHAGADAIMTRVVAVLVIACPCALGIATPMAISAGVASAARSGILISDGSAFELLKKVRCMALDKTGTVTDGSFNVRRTIGGGVSEFSLLVALERRSGHPIASAITAHFASSSAHDGNVTNFRTEESKGIAGSVGGIDVFAGNEKAVVNAGLALTPEQSSISSE
jgi:P-type E1-E2 ATPase